MAGPCTKMVGQGGPMAVYGRFVGILAGSTTGWWGDGTAAYRLWIDGERDGAAWCRGCDGLVLCRC